MPRPLKWTTHASFARGMIQDIPRHLLPDDAVWDADNCFIKESGALAKRGATQTTSALDSGSYYHASLFPHRLWMGAMASGSSDGLKAEYLLPLYDADLGVITGSIGGAAITTTWGAWRLVQPAIRCTGPAFRHFNNVVTPGSTDIGFHYGPISTIGGITSAIVSSAMATPATITVTANSNTITGIAAGDIGKFSVGGYIGLRNATNSYIGRIITVGAASVTVEPTPTVSFTNTSVDTVFTPCFTSCDTFFGSTSAFNITPGTNMSYPFIGETRTGCSFQNRVVLGDCRVYTSASSFERKPNRVWWSVLPTEAQQTSGSGSMVWDGMTWAMPAGYTPYNYVDIPSIDRIVQLVPVGQGALLVLGTNACALITGQLPTLTASTGSITYSVNQISSSIGCISVRSVQATDYGVVFASRNGVMLFDGSRFTNLTEGKIQKLWRDTYATSTIIGSAVVGNNYILSTHENGALCYNLTFQAWTRMSTVYFNASIRDESLPTKVAAAGNTGAVGLLNTDIFDLSTIISPPGASVTDSSTNQVPSPSIKTKAYTEGDPHNLKRYRHTGTAMKLTGVTPSMRVTATPGLAAEDASSILGTIASPAVSPVRSRFDHQLISPGIAYTINVASGTIWEFELYEIRTATNTLRPGRTT